MQVRVCPEHLVPIMWKSKSAACRRQDPFSLRLIVSWGFALFSALFNLFYGNLLFVARLVFLPLFR